MSLIVSVYDDHKNGIESRICFRLRLDQWNVYEAAMVFVDIDPDTTNLRDKDEETFIRFKSFSGNYYNLFADEESFGFGSEELREIVKKYYDMQRILFNPDFEYGTPKYWIERAIAKKVNIPWLEFAVKKGFYVPKNVHAINQKIEKPLNLSFDKTSTTYPNELDLAIQAWQAVSSSKGKGKPKARIKAWLDDNTKLSDAAKERICVVCNWEKLGGATSTD